MSLDQSLLDEMLKNEIDISVDLGVPDQFKLVTVSQLANEMMVMETRILLAAKELKRLTQKHATMAEKTLPDAMRSAGMTEFKLVNDVMVVIEEGLSISVPKKNMGEVCSWLRANKHGDIIKHEIVVPVPKGENSVKQVAKLEASLGKQKLEYTKEENVHSGTLKALLKEQRENGVEINMSLFGAYEWSKASIVMPKETKSKKVAKE